MSSANTYLQIVSKSNEKKTYESRKAQVATTKDKISTVCDNHKDDINSRIDTIKNCLNSGVMGLKADNLDIISTYCDTLNKLKEKDEEKDDKLLEIRNYLVLEINDCNSKISELEAQITSLNAQYQNELKAEREAAQKAIENAKNKASEVATSVSDSYKSVKRKLGSIIK